MLKAQTYNVPLVSTLYAGRFFKFLKDKGVTEEVIITHNPLAKDIINKSDAYISINQIKPIIETAQWLLHDEKAAFEFGQQLDLDSHGLFGYTLLSQEDLPQLVETVVKHMRVCMPIFDMEVLRSGRDVIIRLHDTWDVGPTVKSFIAKMYMGSIYNISSKICSHMRFDADFNSDKQASEWSSLTPNSEWNFNSEHNQVILTHIKKANNNEKLKLVCSLAENQHLNKHAEEQNGNTIYSLVREHISKSLRQASIERSATLLGMSSRYLRQQLAEEGTSFREISNEVRQGYADLYLRDTPMPLNQIANKLGFGDQASFTRAYRNWTGKTPGEIRKEAKNASKDQPL